MSRWIDTANDPDLVSRWEELAANSSALHLDSSAALEEVAEISRLKKVIAYLRELYDSLDPELVPVGTWATIKDSLINCSANVAQFSTSRSIQNIRSANDHLDNLLFLLRPYLFAKGRLAKGLRESVSAYVDTFEEAMSAIQKKALDAETSVSALAAEVEGKQVEMDGLIAEVRKASQEVGNGDSTAEGGLYADIKEKHEKITESFQKIEGLQQRLFDGDAENEAISVMIESAAKAAVAQAALVKQSVVNSRPMLDEIAEFQIRTLGVVDSDGSRVGGVNAELQSLKKSLEDFELAQKKKYETLNLQIESLLPGATSAGLASAYSQMKQSFDKPLRQSEILFYSAIALIVVVAFLLHVHKIAWGSIEFVAAGDLSAVTRNFLYKVPFIAPLVWLAYFASRRRSECQRLQQEYAHKEALAKSYDSYKKQIDDLGGEYSQMMANLIEKAIGAISYNASQTLDGKHGDQMPIQTALEKVLDKIPNSPKGA